MQGSGDLVEECETNLPNYETARGPSDVSQGPRGARGPDADVSLTSRPEPGLRPEADCLQDGHRGRPRASFAFVPR